MFAALALDEPNGLLLEKLTWIPGTATPVTAACKELGKRIEKSAMLINSHRPSRAAALLGIGDCRLRRGHEFRGKVFPGEALDIVRTFIRLC